MKANVDAFQHSNCFCSLHCRAQSCSPSLYACRSRGHTHLDEVAANAEAFQHNEALLLIHFSMRCMLIWKPYF